MKTYKLIFAAAMLSVLACSKEQTPAGNTDTSINDPSDVAEVFSFNAVTDSETKASMGVNENSKPQTFWEDGDQITVYSAGAAEGYLFSTSLSEKAVSATFSHEGGFVESDEYMAIHPAGGSSFNFSGLSVSGVEVPAVQTLVAGSFDRTAAVSLAYSAGEATLPFKNATALLKFQVADERVVAGSVAVSDGENIAGTFTAALDSDNAMAPVLTAENGASEVTFAIDGTTKLTKGTDYYVSVAPTTLAAGFDVTVANAGGSYIKKTYDVESLERNKIYNVGTMTSNEHVSKIELNFNFSDSDAIDFDGWESRSGRTEDITEGTFILNGQTYVFQSAKKTPTTGTTWPSFGGTSDPVGQLHMTQSSCLGLPMIEEFKLSSITIYTEDKNNVQPLYIESDRLTDPTQGIMNQKVIGETHLDLSGLTSKNVAYWMYQAGSGTNQFDMTALKLTYEKVIE